MALIIQFITIYAMFTDGFIFLSYIMGGPWESDNYDTSYIVGLICAVFAFLLANGNKIIKMLFGRNDGNNVYEEVSKADIAFKKIFPTDDKNAGFKKHQIEVINGYYDHSNNDEKKPIEKKPIDKEIEGIAILLLFIVILSLIMSYYIGVGHHDAMNQREFLMTDDNEYVAIPVSEDRYALIEFKEDNNCLILLTGKQNFHEINDYPCTKKTYQEVKIEPMK